MDVVFNTLGGCNAIDYQKNFGSYISELKELRPGHRQMVINRILTRNIQEDISYVKILLIFNEFEKLINILFSSNWILTKVIIKNKKFLKYIVGIKNIFIIKICPKVSYNCRIGILRNLGKLLVQGQDSFYDLIYGKYGKSEANLILTACSQKKIQEMYVKFTDREMIKLYKRFGFSIMNWYYELSNDFIPGNAVINFLVKKQDGSGLLALSKYNKKLGRRGIGLLIDSNKVDIINNPRKYQQWKRSIFRHLKENEWMAYFKNLFPINNLDFSSSDDIYNNLILLPEHGRFAALSTGYHELYKNEIEISVESKLLMAIPIENRSKFIIRNDPMLGDSAVVTSTTLCNINSRKNINYRITMYKMAIHNCKINNDKAALQFILNHISTKGYDYSFPIRESVLLALKEHFKLLHLSEKHWDCVKIIINGFKENNETFFDRVYFTEVDLIKSVRAGKVDYILVNKYLMEGGCFRLWSLEKVSSKVQRQIAMMMGQLINKEYTDQSNLVVEFLNFLEDYNKKTKKTRISYYDYGACLNVLLDQFKNQGNFYYTCIVESVLCYKTETFEQLKLQKMLWRRYLMICDPEAYSQKVIVNILINRPEVIMENAKRIKKNIFTDYNFFYECAKMHYTRINKYFNHIGLKCYKKNFRINIEKYLNNGNANDANIDNSFCKQLYFFSLARTPIPYFDLAIQYINSDFGKKMAAVTTNLLRKTPLENVNTDDIPIYFTTPLIDVHNARRIIEYNTNCDYKQRIKTAINCFARDPSDEYMQLILRIIKPESHAEVLKILHRFHKIPKEKILDYAEFIWSDKQTMTMKIAWNLSIPMLLKLKHAMLHNIFKRLLEMLPSQKTVQFICGYILRDYNFTFFFNAMQSTEWKTNHCTDFILFLCKEILLYTDSENVGVFTYIFLQKLQLLQVPEKMVFQYQIFIELVQSFVMKSFEDYIKDKLRDFFYTFNTIQHQKLFGFEAIHYFSKYIIVFLKIMPLKSNAIRVALAKRMIENAKTLAENYLAISLLPLEIDKLGFGADVLAISQKILKHKDPTLKMLMSQYISSCGKK